MRLDLGQIIYYYLSQGRFIVKQKLLVLWETLMANGRLPR